MSNLLTTNPPFIEETILGALCRSDPSPLKPKLVQIVDATHMLNLEYHCEYGREASVSRGGGGAGDSSSSNGNNPYSASSDQSDVPLGRWNRFHARDSSNTTCEVFLPMGYRLAIENVPQNVREDEGIEGDGRKWEGVLDGATVRLDDWDVSSVVLVTGKGFQRLLKTQEEYDTV